jgi:hypothetical protein
VFWRTLLKPDSARASADGTGTVEMLQRFERPSGSPSLSALALLVRADFEEAHRHAAERIRLNMNDG